MAAKTYEYQGNKITVQYDVKRCIHAAECASGLPRVFDTKRKPWVDPDAAEADEIAMVIMRCPTGALHFQRKDGGADEAVPKQNTIKSVANGPFYMRGDLKITNQDGSVLAKDTRMALCRCGASQNKPFCDGSHSKIPFQDSGSLGKSMAVTEPPVEGQGLNITPLPNGPLAVRGEVTIVSDDGLSSCRGNKLFLCRCGASQNKPFCDSSHKRIGFACD
jgi:CDGSH-type Zn-finger protein/uncharacterized Fe-S cluster protein YjdI